MIASDFQLIGKPKVLSSNFLLSRDFDFGSEDEVSLNIDNDIEISKSTIYENNAQVKLKLSFFKSQDISKVPFHLDIEIQGVFSWGKTIEEEMLDRLLKQNAPAILYSYLRPIITNMTIEANLPPLIIPLMNFCNE